VDFIPENSSEKYIKENSNLGIFDGISNIKSSEQAFRVNFNTIEQAYYLAVTGRYGKDTSEGEVFLWKQVNGDFVLETLVSQLNFIDNADCMTGLMIRQTQESNTPYVAVVLEENGLVSLQYREDPGSPVKKVLFAVKNAEMIQLERKGQSFILSAAKFGEDYERQSIEISGFTGTHQMGFFVSSNSPENPAMVRFGNVRFFEEISVNSEN
jgi:hypothetical protein